MGKQFILAQKIVEKDSRYKTKLSGFQKMKILSEAHINLHDPLFK